jgi:hypothetical protein
MSISQPRALAEHDPAGEEAGDEADHDEDDDVFQVHFRV